MISVYTKTKKFAGGMNAGENMKSAALLQAGDYYFKADCKNATDELTITPIDLNTAPTLTAGKTYTGTMNAKDYLVYKYTNKNSVQMNLKTQTTKGFEAKMGIDDASPATELDGGLEDTKNVSRYYIKGGTNYVLYTQVKAGAYSFKATVKPFKETAKETVTKTNDDYKHAAKLKLGKTYYGAIHFLTDTSDFYKFTIKKKKKVTLTVKADTANVWMSTKKGVQKNDPFDVIYMSSRKVKTKKKKYTLKAGTYYLEMRSGEGDDYKYMYKLK